MADSNPTDRERDPAAPGEADRRVEWVVLAFLLDEYPNQLTVAEASWALNSGAQEFETDDAVERAVRELVGVGLLRCETGFVMPTRAALYFWRLEGGR